MSLYLPPFQGREYDAWRVVMAELEKRGVGDVNAGGKDERLHDAIALWGEHLAQLRMHDPDPMHAEARARRAPREVGERLISPLGLGLDKSGWVRTRDPQRRCRALRRARRLDNNRKDPRMKTYDEVIRVSRRNGRDGERFMSPDEQREINAGWRKAHDVQLGKSWDETDSVSGKTIERAGLQAALKRALDGETDGVMVAKVDRFARTLIGGMTAVGKLREAGKDFVAVKDGVAPDSHATPTGRLMTGILFLFAQWQLESLTEQWVSIRHRHIAAGVSNQEPYGYRKGPDGRLVPDPDEALIVRSMFERRAEGESWQGIARALNDRGIKCRRAVGWTHSRINKIVANRVYLGELRSGDDINRKDAHEAIVPADLWHRANALRGSSKRRDAKEYLLRGLARCATCGVVMRGSTTHKDGRAYRSYACRRHHAWGSCAAPASVNADEIEALVVERFRREFIDAEVIGHQSTEALDAAIAERDAIETEARIALNSDETAAMMRTLGADWYTEHVATWTKRVQDARDREHAARNEALGAELPADLSDMWETLPVDERRGYLSDAFDLVAIARGSGPVAGRFRIYGREEASALDLPRRGHMTGPRPISVA